MNFFKNTIGLLALVLAADASARCGKADKGYTGKIDLASSYNSAGVDYALKTGDVEFFRQGLAAGMNCEIAVHETPFVSPGGRTYPLYKAMFLGQDEIAHLLISNGAKLSIFDNTGEGMSWNLYSLNPLDVASWFNRPSVAKEILIRDPEAKTRWGKGNQILGIVRLSEYSSRGGRHYYGAIEASLEMLKVVIPHHLKRHKYSAEQFKELFYHAAFKNPDKRKLLTEAIERSIRESRYSKAEKAGVENMLKILN